MACAQGLRVKHSAFGEALKITLLKGVGGSIQALGLCLRLLTGVTLQCQQFGLRVMPLQETKGLHAALRDKSYGVPFSVWFHGCPFGLELRVKGFPFGDRL